MAFQLRKELPKAVLLPPYQRIEAHRNGVELFLWCESVYRSLHHTIQNLLLQDAYPHHHELVEVRAEDGEKPEPGQQRCAEIFRQLEYAAVELQPTQLFVYELIRHRFPRMERFLRKFGLLEIGKSLGTRIRHCRRGD